MKRSRGSHSAEDIVRSAEAGGTATRACDDANGFTQAVTDREQEHEGQTPANDRTQALAATKGAHGSQKEIPRQLTLREPHRMKA